MDITRVRGEDPNENPLSDHGLVVDVVYTTPEARKVQFKSASQEAAACDLCSLEDRHLGPGETVLLDTGVRIHIRRPNVFGMIASRSGLSVKHGIVVVNGVGIIDPDYQGNLMVALHNISNRDYYVESGDRVAQLLFVPIINEVYFRDLPQFSGETGRGTGGFGSTGDK